MHIFACLAEFERDLIKERSAEGRREAKKKGVRFGRPKQPKPERASMCALLYRNGNSVSAIMRTTGIRSRNAVYKYLSMEGVELKKKKSLPNVNQETDIREYLIDKLKEEHCFWSYDNDSINDIPDEMLVELVMIHLDLPEINLLFKLLPFQKVKRLWIENVVAQGERYYTLNFFLAWYYFDVKRPHSYVKAMATRQLNKKMGIKRGRMAKKQNI